MLVEQLINLQWDTQVDADDVLEAVYESSGMMATTVELVPFNTATFDDYYPGRVRVYLDENNCIWQINTDD